MLKYLVLMNYNFLKIRAIISDCTCTKYDITVGYTAISEVRHTPYFVACTEYRYNYNRIILIMIIKSHQTIISPRFTPFSDDTLVRSSELVICRADGVYYILRISSILTDLGQKKCIWHIDQRGVPTRETRVVVTTQLSMACLWKGICLAPFLRILMSYINNTRLLRNNWNIYPLPLHIGICPVKIASNAHNKSMAYVRRVLITCQKLYLYLTTNYREVALYRTLFFQYGCNQYNAPSLDCRHMRRTFCLVFMIKVIVITWTWQCIRSMGIRITDV